MSIPAIIYLVLTAIGLLLVANLHGQSRKPWSFWQTAYNTAFTSGLLYWGGFFS